MLSLLSAVAQRFTRFRESLHCFALSQSVYERTKKLRLGGGWGGLSPWLDLQKPIQGSGVRMQ